MPLTAGTRLGPYEILSPIGAGGMGEVYRARDTRLHRDVAIKVLPDDVRDDARRLARFAQEARATAALNHPNILAVVDVATEGPTPYLVSELLEGATLGARLRATSGRMATSRALDYARQLAHALSAAHARGIVHRDLKPENIFVTDDSRVKVLDFGLARVGAPADGMATTTTGGEARTDRGTVLGTLGYMAPEQLRGQTVDARADLFSLGAVLYEMLAGRRAFDGDTAADTISAVLSRDAPDLFGSPEYPVAPALARLVQRCLEKDPAARFQTASDLAFALEAVAGSSMSGSGPAPAMQVAHAPTGQRWSTLVVAAGTAVVTAAVTLGSVAWWTKSVSPGLSTEVARFEIELPSDMAFATRGAGRLSVSPDGRHIAFTALKDGVIRVYIRPLDSTTPTAVPGSEDVRGSPFWSPDSRSIGFFVVGGEIKRVDLGALAAKTIVDLGRGLVAQAPRGSWNAAGALLFAAVSGTPIQMVPVAGGTPIALTTLQDGESHEQPNWLPDGVHFTYAIVGTSERVGVWVASTKGGPSIRVSDEPSYAQYVAGHLVFVRDGVLQAVPFDATGNRKTGEQRALPERAAFAPGTPALQAGVGLSSTGTLVYSTVSSGLRQFIWVDRGGRELSRAGAAGPWGNFDLSTDETRVVVIRNPTAGYGTVSVLDLAREVETRLTVKEQDGSPSWSRDGQRVVFNRRDAAAGVSQVIAMPSNGGPETVLFSQRASQGINLDDWSPDGRFITFNQDPALWALPVGRDATPFAFVKTDGANVDESHFAPDGRWIAYNSNESGTWQVYLAPWPATGERWQVSNSGGADPRWRGDGRELYYLALDGTLMSVEVAFSPGPRLGQPRPLFQTGVAVNPRADHYAAAKDGQRFLLRRDLGVQTPLTVVLNWSQLLADRSR